MLLQLFAGKHPISLNYICYICILIGAYRFYTTTNNQKNKTKI